MSHKYEFISMATILAKHHRDMRGLDVHETDALEWAGEALGYIKMPTVSEEALVFLEVKDYEVNLPPYLHYIIQVAKHTGRLSMDDEMALKDTADTGEQINLQYDYLEWQRHILESPTWYPVKLANHTFFNSVVCREQDERIKKLYASCQDEYTVVQAGYQRKLRFSFETGYVALAYSRQKCDPATGYPMIPDNEYCTSAINYYLVWKLMERYCWNGREGACQRADRAMTLWEKYIGKFKNHAMMPFSVDQYQNLANQGNYLVPQRRAFDNFFGNIGLPEARPYNNPISNRK